jgi:hypothetical protein
MKPPRSRQRAPLLLSSNQAKSLATLVRLRLGRFGKTCHAANLARSISDDDLARILPRLELIVTGQPPEPPGDENASPNPPTVAR